MRSAFVNKLLCSRSRKLIPAHTFVETGLAAAWFESAVTLCWTEELFLAYQRVRRLNHLPRFLNPCRPLETRQSAHMRVCTLLRQMLGFLFRLALTQTKSTSSGASKIIHSQKNEGLHGAHRLKANIFTMFTFL
jgi:hypothetical protein